MEGLQERVEETLSKNSKAMMANFRKYDAHREARTATREGGATLRGRASAHEW